MRGNGLGASGSRRTCHQSRVSPAVVGERANSVTRGCNCRVLGPLEVVGDDDIAITFRGAQLRRALTTLALHAPSSTPVEELRDVLWPDGAPSPNALQALISKLRKAIAPMTIDANGSAYSLVLGTA